MALLKIKSTLLETNELPRLEESPLRRDEFIVLDAYRVPGDENEFVLEIQPPFRLSEWVRVRLPGQRRRPARGLWHRYDAHTGRLRVLRYDLRYRRRWRCQCRYCT